jgi:hypothetical protein
MKWTRDFFRIATASGTRPPFWDGVAIHPYDTLHYHRNGGLKPPLFEAAAESMRSAMRDYNDDGELWITEWGSPTYTPPEYGQQANELAEAFVLAKASETNVQGRYDRMCWYSFLDGAGTDPHGGFGLLDTMYQPKASMYASGQTA